jgi:hypothetical protein
LPHVEVVAGVRRVGVFRLTDGWRSIGDVDEAARLARAARQAPSPRAISRPVVAKATKPAGVQAEAEKVERTRRRARPSLPRLTCL